MRVSKANGDLYVFLDDDGIPIDGAKSTGNHYAALFEAHKQAVMHY